MDVVAILTQSPIFSGLEPDELDAVTKCVVHGHYAAGDVVIKEGTPGEALYLVGSGKLRVEKETDGKKLTLAEIGPGQAFGEMSLIDSFETSATVTAVEDTDLFSIKRLDVNVLLNWDTVLAAKVWRSFTFMLSQRLRDMNERMLTRFGAEAFRES